MGKCACLEFFLSRKENGNNSNRGSERSWTALHSLSKRKNRLRFAFLLHLFFFFSIELATYIAASRTLLDLSILIRLLLITWRYRKAKHWKFAAVIGACVLQNFAGRYTEFNIKYRATTKKKLEITASAKQLVFNALQNLPIIWTQVLVIIFFCWS